MICKKCKTELMLCSHGYWNCPKLDCGKTIIKASKEELELQAKELKKFMNSINPPNN